LALLAAEKKNKRSHRLDRLIKTLCQQNLAPRSLLGTTFTRRDM